MPKATKWHMGFECNARVRPENVFDRSPKCCCLSFGLQILCLLLGSMLSSTLYLGCSKCFNALSTLLLIYYYVPHNYVWATAELYLPIFGKLVTLGTKFCIHFSLLRAIRHSDQLEKAVLALMAYMG